MHARAAIIGRVARERSERRSRILIQPPPSRPTASKLLSYVPMSKKCFIPCSRGPCLTLLLAMILLAAGAAMCNFAFHANDYASNVANVNNQTTEVTDQSLYRSLKSLAYVGPTFMGVGAFLIIICCVLLLDTREKLLRNTAKQRVEQQQDLSREYTNKAILSRQANKKPLDIIASMISSCDSNGDESHAGLINDQHDEEKAIEQTSCDHMKAVITINQANGPKVTLGTRRDSSGTRRDSSATSDKWFPLITLSASLYERDTPICKQPASDCADNGGYEHSNYNLKTSSSFAPTTQNGTTTSQDKTEQRKATQRTATNARVLQALASIKQRETYL